jgi:hypothetical protein
MRIAALFTLIIILTAGARADELSVILPPPPPPVTAINPVAFASAGGVMVPIGVAAMGVAAYFLTKNIFACGLYDDSCTAAQRAAISRDDSVGLGTALGGVATIAIGIPLLIVGANRISQTRAGKKVRASVDIAPYVVPQAGGGMAGVAVRF